MEINFEAGNIVAIATAFGHAGIGIVRVSGSDLSYLIRNLLKRTSLKHRFATYCDFFDSNDEVIDSGIALYFRAPHSFTGEEVLELQGHGSPMALRLLVNRCLELGCRMANPGEFSRRAYLNAKIDLVQAESIIDLIHAESAAAAKGAIRSLQGTFSTYINQVNQKLINIRMFIESSIDFPDEDIEFINKENIYIKLKDIQEELSKLLESTKRGVLLNDGANVVIIGKPNVGKSSLLNSLAETEVAIVTDIAGTTRDVIKEKIQIQGVVLNIFDTAGIRDTEDIVEQIGIKRALDAINNADLCLVLVDIALKTPEIEQGLIELIPKDVPILIVHNKIDLLPSGEHALKISDKTHVYVSAKTGEGLEQLKCTILEAIGFNDKPTILEDIYIARSRHLEAIQLAVEHINKAFLCWQHLELLAHEVREAHLCLTRITGEFTSDDLLGEIFQNFCIGK
jgi:tRNA modification GTPase